LIVCDPTDSEGVMNTAVPNAFNGDDPRTVLPSLKVTVPAGIPPVDEITVAVKVTACPTDEGLTEDVSVVVVVACVTVCERADDELPRKLVSPPYSAVMAWVPVERLDVLKAACPDELRVPVPIGAPPSLNVTLPVRPATLEVTRAVKVTIWPATAGFLDELTLVEVDALLTVCVTGADVLARKLALPA
jgi:hypothetical protein